MEPLNSFTYVRKVEGKVNSEGRVVFCDVTLATGHSLLVHVDQAPKPGDQAQIAVTFTGQPSLLEVVE